MFCVAPNCESTIIGRRALIHTNIHSYEAKYVSFGVWPNFYSRRRRLMSQAMDHPSRHLADFEPTLWGHHFLSYTPQQTEISTQERVEIDEYKEMVRKTLVETPDNSRGKLVLIDAIQRLGVAYHFHKEIETSIQNIFDSHHGIVHLHAFIDVVF